MSPPFLPRTPFSSTSTDFYQQIYEVHSSLLGPISFIFMQFSEKNWPNNRLTPPPCGLTPPLSGCSRCSQITPSAKSWLVIWDIYGILLLRRATAFKNSNVNSVLTFWCHRLLLPVGFATRRCLVNESQIHKSLSYHSLLPMSHMKYITVHKILWAQTLAHMRTLKYSVLRGQSSHSTTKINESYFELSYPMMVDDNIYQKYYKW